MRIVVVSDVHSNIVALETVLSAAGQYDALWCLGDTIGYGPAPNACVASMMKHAHVAISGNHDLACLGKVDLSDFNPDARKANIWNGEQLTPEHRAWLEQLSPMCHPDDQFTIAHASPREPVWEYLLTPTQALENLTAFDTQNCLVGHSHVQLFFRINTAGFCERVLPKSGYVEKLSNDNRYIINPGSVGQPRDQDPRAAYIVLDTDKHTVRFNRIEYNIAKTQQQMKEVALPEALIRRLSHGM